MSLLLLFFILFLFWPAADAVNLARPSALRLSFPERTLWFSIPAMRSVIFKDDPRGRTGTWTRGENENYGVKERGIYFALSLNTLLATTAYMIGME